MDIDPSMIYRLSQNFSQMSLMGIDFIDIYRHEALVCPTFTDQKMHILETCHDAFRFWWKIKLNTTQI